MPSPRHGPHTPATLLRRAWALGLVMLLGCGSHDDEAAPVACAPVSGVWQVAATYDNGLVAHQQWAVAESACDVHISTAPPDTYGPLPDTASGNAVGTTLWASGSKTSGACRLSSNITLDLNAQGTAFSGTLTWVRSGWGQGYCPSAFGELALSGQR